MGENANTETRAAQLAGAWYPADADKCLRTFAGFADEAAPAPERELVAGIVPHAGWVFSGAVAHSVLAALAARGAGADTVALFAGHLGPRSPMTVMTHGACETPFGPLAADDELAARLLDRVPALRGEGPRDHSQDNSAEVVFPMIKHFFPAARALVIGAPPRASSIELAEALVEEAATSGRRLLLVGSTDLTHYGPNYGFTPHGVGAAAERWVREVNDPSFIERATAMDPEATIATALAHHSACCPGAVAATIRGAAQLGARRGELLRYATSADVRPASSFVGYAGIVY